MAIDTHQLTQKIFTAINLYLNAKGLLLKEGTIEDATLIAAPPSTKNREGQRDPEMHQSKKGNQWHFGMKAHIGVDAVSGLVHSLVTTAANVHDVTQAHALLHGEETTVFADAGYVGAQKREENRVQRFPNVKQRRNSCVCSTFPTQPCAAAPGRSHSSPRGDSVTGDVLSASRHARHRAHAMPARHTPSRWAGIGNADQAGG